MKQSLKYGLLLVLSLLIYTAVNQAMGSHCKETTLANCQKESYASLNSPIDNALKHFYFSLSTQSSDLSHLDITFIPVDKSIALFISHFRESKHTQRILQDDSSHIPKYSADPITYYIYGLRKIVI